MKFTLEMDMDNAAFEDGRQLGDILNRLAERVPEHPRGDDAGVVSDVNGNVVGSWMVTA